MDNIFISSIAWGDIYIDCNGEEISLMLESEEVYLRYKKNEFMEVLRDLFERGSK